MSEIENSQSLKKNDNKLDYQKFVFFLIEYSYQ